MGLLQTNSQVANNGVQVLPDHADLGSATFNAVSERRTAPELCNAYRKKTLEIEWGCPSRPEEATGDPVESASSTGEPCKKAL
jgi:hypothetical protein